MSQNIYDDDPTATEQSDEQFDEQFDKSDEQVEEQAEEQGENIPVIYVDGDVVTAADNRPLPWTGDLDTVQVAFPAAENGEQSEADEAAPLGWANSAAIQLDRQEDAIHLSISVGDPRGAFVLTVRRLPDGTLVMHYPHPDDTWLHMPLKLLRTGTYQVGF